MLDELLAAWRRPGPPTATIRTIYVRAIAAVHVLALGSFQWQADALVGPRGILPCGWDTRPWTLLGLGIAASVVLGSPFEGPSLVALWAIYLAICNAGQVFLEFQWDSLLVEATLCALFVARWRPGPVEPPRWAWWAQWWLVFRLMFFGGEVKLASGDPTWRDLTALDLHFWTQPLPNPSSRWAHHWPHGLHAVGVLYTFVVELLVPFALPFGRRARLFAACAFASLMGMLAFTGNYGFFQVLAVVLCLSLLDDGWLPERFRVANARAGRSWLFPLALAWFAVTLLWIPGYRALPAWGQAVLRETADLRSANPYGLFAVMTTDRREIQLEGSDDGGATWRELDLRDKPGSDLARVPPQVAPDMPRVDWQLWFAALGDCRRNPWLVRLMQRVTQGSPAVEVLFRPGTFDAFHPTEVRARIWRYTFTEPGSPDVWHRELLGDYCPTVGRR